VTLPAELYFRPALESELSMARGIDDDACEAFKSIGLALDLAADHPFALAEVARWAEAAGRQQLIFACSAAGEPVGFAALGTVDSRPYLDQLSVRRAWMGKGIGGAFVERAKEWSSLAGELWLTTYDERVPWNQPWYARLGFVRVPEAGCGPELRRKLEAERASLPAPEARVAMRFQHPR